MRDLRRLQLGLLRRRPALAARFEPGRPHLGDQLADAERGPGADPALASGQPHGSSRTLPLWPASQKGEFPPERFEGYTQIFQFPSLNWGSNALEHELDRPVRESATTSRSAMGSHDLKVGGGYVRLFSPEEQSNNIGTWVFDTDQFFDGTAGGDGQPAQPDSVHRVVPAAAPQPARTTGFRATCRTSGACGRT